MVVPRGAAFMQVQAYHCVSYAQAVVSRDGNVSLGRHSSSGSSSSSSSLSNDGTSACETQRLSSDSAFTPPAVAVVAAVEPDRGQGAVKDAISRVQPSTIQSCLAAPAVANYSAIDIGSVQGGGSGGGMGSEGSDRTDGAHSADQTTTAAATAASTSRSSRDSMDSLTCSTRNYSIALQHAAPVGCTNAAAGAAAVAAADADIAASGHTTPDQQQATLLGELLLAGPARAESWLVMVSTPVLVQLLETRYTPAPWGVYTMACAVRSFMACPAAAVHCTAAVCTAASAHKLLYTPSVSWPAPRSLVPLPSMWRQRSPPNGPAAAVCSKL